MSTSPATPAWIRLFTPTGLYEYQFHGHTPAVRAAAYLPARDYLFLLMDEERLLYRIPVQLTDDVPAALTAAELPADSNALARIAEAALIAGLQKFRPRAAASFIELDANFRVDAASALTLARTT